MSIILICFFDFFVKISRIFFEQNCKKRARLIARLDIVVFVVLRKQFYVLFFLTTTTAITATAIDTHTTGTTTAIMILLR